MPDPIQQNQNLDEIIIRTMQEDLSASGLGTLKKEEVKPQSLPTLKVPAPPMPAPPVGGTIGQIVPPLPAMPTALPAPTPSVPKLEIPLPPTPLPTTQAPVVVSPIMPPRPTPPVAGGLPELKIPPRIIPPREIPAIPPSPLPKAAPIWIRLAIIAVIVFLVTFFGLYIYWKIFIQGQAPAAPAPPQATTTIPTLPTTQPPVPAQPIKFFNKLPSKAVTIDLAIKDTANLQRALQSEVSIQEERESIKQILLTYQGKPIELSDFLNLMQIFVPLDFLSNYENQYAFFYFGQKEGARAGLIFKAKDPILAQTQMQEWEKSTLPSDVLPLFPTTLRNIKTPIKFKSYSLSGQPVRYVNVPVPFSSLNYSIYKDFLVITTSSRGMFRIMNDLSGQTTSRVYLDILEATIDHFVR